MNVNKNVNKNEVQFTQKGSINLFTSSHASKLLFALL